MKPPEFGEPVENIGPVRQKPETGFWQQVVNHAKANPGMWIPLVNPPNSKRSLVNMASAMRRRDQDQTPVPMREYGMKAQMVGDVFYFRFDPKDKLHIVQSGGQLWPNEYNPQGE